MQKIKRPNRFKYLLPDTEYVKNMEEWNASKQPWTLAQKIGLAVLGLVLCFDALFLVVHLMGGLR